VKMEHHVTGRFRVGPIATVDDDEVIMIADDNESMLGMDFDLLYPSTMIETKTPLAPAVNPPAPTVVANVPLIVENYEPSVMARWQWQDLESYNPDNPNGAKRISWVNYPPAINLVDKFSSPTHSHPMLLFQR